MISKSRSNGVSAALGATSVESSDMAAADDDEALSPYSLMAARLARQFCSVIRIAWMRSACEGFSSIGSDIAVSSGEAL